MHTQLFTALLGLVGSGLGSPTPSCGQDCKQGLELNNLFDNIFAKKEGNATAQHPAAVGSGDHPPNADFFQSLFKKNATEPERAPAPDAAKAVAPEQKQDIGAFFNSLFGDKKNQTLSAEKPQPPPEPSKKATAVPATAAEKGIDTINAKYKAFVDTLLEDEPAPPPKPANFFDGLGNLAQGLAGANKAAEGIGKDIKTVAQVHDIEMKAIGKAKNIIQKHPEILTNIGLLIDNLPESFDFTDAETVAKTLRTVEKLKPEITSQVHSVLKDLQIDEAIIPKDYLARISRAISAAKDQLSQPVE